MAPGEEEPAAARHLSFLARGGSAYTIDVLRYAVVDMSTPAPVEATMEVFGERLAELEGLV